MDDHDLAVRVQAKESVVDGILSPQPAGLKRHYHRVEIVGGAQGIAITVHLARRYDQNDLSHRLGV
jgi:hypothetical protein